MPARKVAIMGSTGSVGGQAMDVIRQDREGFEVVSLLAGANVELLAKQVKEFSPKVVAAADDSAFSELARLDLGNTEVVKADDFDALLSGTELVLNAVSGFSGLAVTLAAVRMGLVIGLANKESLVAAGDLVSDGLDRSGASLIPVDSEHSALFQALNRSCKTPRDLKELVLTASGGPFRDLTADELEAVTLADALNHPNWSMGEKITIDSSTLFNKGLEVIEAHYLFGIDYDRIRVVVHPESIVHSMVTFSDGTTLAQLSEPDMRLPIAIALYYPNRSSNPWGELDWSRSLELHFEPLDRDRFRSVSLAFEMGKRGGGATCWLNAANEVAVGAFIAGSISWKDIYQVVATACDRYRDEQLTDIKQVYEIDHKARMETEEVLRNL